MNTTSKLDLANAAVRQHRRMHQVLVSRPMSLDELPPASRFNDIKTSTRVLQTQRSSVQRSLF